MSRCLVAHQRTRAIKRDGFLMTRLISYLFEIQRSLESFRDHNTAMPFIVAQP